MPRRIAALYDIHGNLPALEAVLADVHDAGIDRLVVGGDVVPGPLPAESLALLERLDVPVSFIFGNGEIAALAEVEGRPSGVPEMFCEVVRWSGEQLTVEQRRTIAAWPKTVTLAVEGLGDVLFCHATPRHENEIFTRLTPAEQLGAAFAGVSAPIVVCGHTHMPFDRRVGDLRVVNAGSVGMPFGERGAYWLLLGPGVEPRSTRYDLDAAAARIRASPYPRAREFAENELLNPRRAEDMETLFERQAITA